MSDEGFLVARHGDKTACGATLLASQSMATVGGGDILPPTAGEPAAAGFFQVSFPVSQPTPANPGDVASQIGNASTTLLDFGLPSGAAWVAQFPTSNETTTLAEPFRNGTERFIAALRSAGAAVNISATLRPPERAYLMHWSWRIVHGTAPAEVPARPGVEIDWQHRDSAGVPDPTAALAGAQAMVNGYGIASLGVPPALNSRHIQGNAIDMTITWVGTLNLANASGELVTIATQPRTGMNAQLAAVGVTYGVYKFVGGAADRPHWSADGH